MPAPSAADFARLRSLVAIEDLDARQSRPIEEVFTGRELTTIPVGTAEDVAAAFAKARAAQRGWAHRPVAERAAIMERFRDLVAKNRDFLMDVAQAETGKARSAAQEEIVDMMLNARYYARQAVKLLAPKRVQGLLPGVVKTVVNHHPKGVVGVISPWNYPMALSISDSIPALLAGNAVVVKPDSQTPYCTLANAELLYEAGLPRDLFAVVPGPGSVVGTAIVENCDYLMFTGSTATGRTLAEQCGRRLIGFSAELGGKNPMIVTRGAKLDVAAKAATRACFSNAGQLCISIERIYVERAVADEFTAKFGEQVRSMRLAATYDFTADMGSLISEDQIKTVSGHVDDAKAKGATVIAGGTSGPTSARGSTSPPCSPASPTRWSARATRRSAPWSRSIPSNPSPRPSRRPTTPSTGSTPAFGPAAKPRVRPSQRNCRPAPSTSTRATPWRSAARRHRWAA